MKIFK